MLEVMLRLGNDEAPINGRFDGRPYKYYDVGNLRLFVFTYIDNGSLNSLENFIRSIKMPFNNSGMDVKVIALGPDQDVSLLKVMANFDEEDLQEITKKAGVSMAQAKAVLSCLEGGMDGTPGS